MDLPTMQLDPKSSGQQRAICIIGAGPAGLGALKIIADTEEYKTRLWTVVAYESRDRVGGVWYPAPPVDDPPLTPLYDSLTTNLPHPVMAYSSFLFPPSTPLFPHADKVLEYLDAYTDHFDIRKHVLFNTTVTSVNRSAEGKWIVQTSAGAPNHFDLVLVCNGHYRIPRYPDTPGLGPWMNAKKASHSAWYRHPHIHGDKVLVVGAGPSGNDISSEMCTVAKTVIHSVRGATPETKERLCKRGAVVKFGDVKDGEVTFEDGTTERGITYCILATGYEYSYPFLSDSILKPQMPPPLPPLPAELYNSTFGLFPLARQLFPLQNDFPPTSLAFLGLPTRLAPLPGVEAQARAIVAVFRDPSLLDTMQEAVDIMTRYEVLRARHGDNPSMIYKKWHTFEPAEIWEYRDSLLELARSAKTSWSAEFSRIQAEYEKCGEWEKEFYGKKDILRKAWVLLEQRGEAESWVKGVGENGLQDWIDMMSRLDKWANDNGLGVSDAEKSRL